MVSDFTCPSEIRCFYPNFQYHCASVFRPSGHIFPQVRSSYHGIFNTCIFTLGMLSTQNRNETTKTDNNSFNKLFTFHISRFSNCNIFYDTYNEKLKY